MNIDIVNINYRKLLSIKKKNIKIFNKHLIKCLNYDNNLHIRTMPEYSECMNIILDNMNQMYDSIIGRNCFVESDQDDLEISFAKIEDKQFFLKNFFIFNKLSIKNNIYNELDIKFQAVSDFFTLILNKEDVEILMRSLNKELNDILDIKKENIEERLEIIDEIIDKINESIHTSKPEKKNFGEIFTAFALINMMLDKLPEHVWKDPYLKWLDPANGYGNFPAIVVQRLMKSLQNVVIPETDLSKPKLRFKWIMEKMIYVCDINIKNMKIFIELFDREGELGIKFNFFRGSFLNRTKFESKMKEWKVGKFDIIMGNPPYQDQSKGQGKLGSFPFWIKFVNESFRYSKENGYIVFIHPSLWRQADDTKCEVLRKSNISYLSINNEKEGLKIFGADTRFDWYVTQNCEYQNITEVKDEEGNLLKINLNEWTFIPNMMFDDVKKLLSEKDLDKIEILHSYSIYETRKSHMSLNKDNKFIYPCVYMISKEGKMNLYFSSVKKDFFVTKVIVPPGRIISVNVVGDVDGEYGLTQFSWGIKCEKDEVEKIVKALNSKKFKKIAYACSVSKLEYNKNIIGKFKKDFWKEFQEDEIDQINFDNFQKEKNINIEDSNFKIGELYEYTGKSKKINSKEVELVKILKTSYQIKDILGNVSNVKKETLKIKDE